MSAADLPATFPRWIAGGPDDTSARSPSLLREVARNLYVGSALSAPHAPLRGAIVVQLSEHCPPVAAMLAAGALAVLRLPFEDRGPIPPNVLRQVVAEAAARRPMLVQCHAGLSRSAAVAYAVLRRVDGLPHDAALARVAHAVEHNDRTERWPHAVTLASARAWCDAQEAGAL